jgi:hypothetical protein
MIDFLVLHCEDAKTRESNELRKSEALTEKRRLPAKHANQRETGEGLPTTSSFTQRMSRNKTPIPSL